MTDPEKTDEPSNMDEDLMRLPRANLITAINGGEGALKSMIQENSSDRFNGYIKVTMKVGPVPANGLVIIMVGKPESAYYLHDIQRALGQDALPKIFDLTQSRRCVLKLYSFPGEAKESIAGIVEKFNNCRIDFQKFMAEVAHRPPISPDGNEKPGVMDQGKVDEVLVGASDAFKTVASKDVLVEDVREEDEAKVDPLDESKITKVEEALKNREEKIRQEIEEKLVEREELKQEEEKFLKMDEVFTKLQKDRDDEFKVKNEELNVKEKGLKTELDKKEKLLSDRETELKGQMVGLQKEREEMRLRETKLHEMEKMFRRVLANTEDRLRKKEEELIMKEEELKREVAERLKLIEDLKLREARVLEMEQHLKAKAHLDEVASDEIKRREERIKQLEAEVTKSKENLDKMVKEVEGTKDIHSDLKVLLKVLDDLLGKLPEATITEFAQSKEYEMYDKVMRHFKLVNEDNK
jgi:hypothetical protein